MNDKVHIFDKPQNVRRVLWALVAMCIATIGADLFTTATSCIPGKGYGAFMPFTDLSPAWYWCW